MQVGLQRCERSPEGAAAALGDTLEGVRGDVAGKHVATAQRSDERGQGQPAAELQHARPRQVERGEVCGERASARPQLGPVGRVAPRVGGHRKELLGLAGTQKAHPEAADGDGILEVDRHPGSRSSTSAARISPRCEYAWG